RGDRSPAIAPISTGRLSRELIKTGAVDWRLSNVRRIARGFYISQAMELSREVRG
ncbi:MAG: magnesium protoporphyrin IX methyltransferase, partial [Pseudomonadota bacterium]